MTKEIISFKIEEEIKKEAEKLFSEIGMTVEEALNIFIKRSVKEKRIPFEIRLDVSNKEDNLEFIYVEALKSLIKKGYTNDEIVEEFEKDINLIKSEIEVENPIPSNLSSIELLSYKIDASIGDVQSFDSTEYYHTDLNETYQILNNDILLTNAIITTKGDNFYSRIKSANTDEYHKHITRIDVDFWIED